MKSRSFAIPSLSSVGSAVFLICVFVAAAPGRAQDSGAPNPVATAESPAKPAADEPVSAPPPAVEPVAVAVPDILATLDDTTIFLKAVATGISDSQRIPNSIPELTVQIDARAKKDGEALDGRPSLEALRSIEAEWSSIGKRLSDLKSELTTRATQTEADLTRIADLETRWQATLDAAPASSTPPGLVTSVRAMIGDLMKARDQVLAERASLLAMQEKVAVGQNRVTAALEQIGDTRQAMVGELFMQLNPPLWKVDLRSGVQTGLTTNVPSAFTGQWNDLLKYLNDYAGRLLAHGAILIFLLIYFSVAARRVKEWPNSLDNGPSVFIFKLPYSSAIVLAIMFGVAIYPLPPPAWTFLLGGFALLLAIRILRRKLHRAGWPALNLIAFFFFVDRLCEIAAGAPLIERLLFLLEMLGGTAVVLWLIRYRLTQTKPDSEGVAEVLLIRKAAWTALCLLAFAFLADILGFLSLARYIGHGATSSAFLAVIVYALLLIVNGLIVFGFRSRPLNLLTMVQRLGELIELRFIRATRLIAMIAWALGALEVFSMLAPLFDFVKSVATASFKVRDFQISLMDFVLFFGVVYLSNLISRFVRFLLNEEIFPRSDLPRGAPFAVSAVVHYVILIVGFFIALGMVGIDLTRITVLVGALGVGIGFGLQTIVNNFVSGLILLLERPLNVGDVVEVGGSTGELRRIGLRASVLRVADGSEVIVPNGSLISNQVTNWTLTDHQRRIEIAVGVAYGTDPEEVIRLLLSVAENHPDILKDPEPQSLFIAFGDSSLNFILRAWTTNIKRWPLISSQMTIGVNRVLTDANISIPFPQRDLHIIPAVGPGEVPKAPTA